MTGNNLEKGVGGIYQHRCGIILPKALALLHVCLLVSEGPLVWRLFCLPLRQHLGNVSVAAGLWRILLPGCAGHREGGDDGSL